jgi:hypothetical protein
MEKLVIFLTIMVLLNLSSQAWGEVGQCNLDGAKVPCVETKFFVKKGDVLEDIFRSQITPFADSNKQIELDRKDYVRVKTVLSFISGDTFMAWSGHRNVQMHIAGLDASKNGQPYSKEFTKNVCKLFDKIYSLSSEGKYVEDHVCNTGRSLVISGLITPSDKDGHDIEIAKAILEKEYADNDTKTGSVGNIFSYAFIGKGCHKGMWSVPGHVHPRDLRNKPMVSPE